MVRMINHADASELLGAYALDAVEADEAVALESHLETCPRCRAELSSHREVVGLLAYAGQEAPEGLWDRVVSRINDTDEPAAENPLEPPHSLRLVRVELDGTPKPVGAGSVAKRPGRRWFSQATSMVAAAAVVIVALLGVEVVRLQDRTNHLSGQISTAMADQPSMANVKQALAVPGARRVVLTPVAGGSANLDAVILPSGDGYLYDSRLTPLASAQTYQLWGIEGTQEVSYGVLGSSPAPVVAFRAGSGLEALAVTAEVAGGVVTSDHSPVAVGRIV